MKVTISGVGRTGAAIAFALVMRRLGDELVLVSRDPDGKAAGDAIDLAQAGLYLDPKPLRIRAGSVADSRGSDVVIVTNSVRLERVVTRRDYATANAPVIREVVPALAEQSPDAVFIILSNPVDVTTYLALRYGGLPPERVIGTGTLIDTGRFRALVAAHTGIHSRDVRAYILGEHGESMVCALSQATAGGVRLPESDETILANFRAARRAGYDVFERKGYTDYAIAACVAMIVEAIADDTHEVMPVSTLMRGQYEISEVCLSLPCVIGRGGVLRVLEPDLSTGEIAALRASAQTVRGLIDAAVSAEEAASRVQAGRT